MQLLEFFVNGLVPDDESLCLIARANDFGVFDPTSPARLEVLSDFSQGYRSPSVTLPDGEYKFFGSCAEICKYCQGSWLRETATTFIQYISYVYAVDSIRAAYGKLQEIDSENLPTDERQQHLASLADMEAVAVKVERFRLNFDPEI